MDAVDAVVSLDTGKLQSPGSQSGRAGAKTYRPTTR